MNRLKELRLKKGMTQIKVQIETGIDQSDYSKMENGKRSPTLEQAKVLSHLYETSVDYICGVTDEIRPYPRADRRADRTEAEAMEIRED